MMLLLFPCRDLLIIVSVVLLFCFYALKVLSYEQVSRLHRLLDTPLPVHGRGNFPTLEIKLKDLIQVVHSKLSDNRISLKDVRLNGGAASYVLGNETVESYNDVDLIFGLELTGHSELQKIKDLVLESLLEFLPKGVNKSKMSVTSLNDAYVHKMIKIFTDLDRWSLISLSNARGRNVELKFADAMRRQFEFSVDSFQIILDSVLTFYEISPTPPKTLTEDFYPTVVAESVYGDFSLALYHLNNKLITTRSPEEIRGGGLLKYCHLLVRGYTPIPDCDVRLLERYMCARFFIDFSDVADQRAKLVRYLTDHFRVTGDGKGSVNDDDDVAARKYEYLMTLGRVVSESTLCLMGFERRQTIELIQMLARGVARDCQRHACSKASNWCETLNRTFQPQLFSPSGFILGIGGACRGELVRNFGVTTTTASNLIIEQIFYGPFNAVSYPGAALQRYYTVYTYKQQEKGASQSNASSNVTVSVTAASVPTSSRVLTTTATSCPYCEDIYGAAAAGTVIISDVPLKA